MADTTIMSVDSIASLSTAMSQAQLQSAVAMKVLKLAQGSDQVTADLLDATLESVEASMQQFTEDAGANIDAFA